MAEARLTTAEAADRLGVKPETLYAYVSRGLIERRRQPGGPSTFAARDVERLVRAGRRSRALPPLVFPSSLTLIEEGRYSYRGVDAVEAAARHPFEEVAEWLWSGRVARRGGLALRRRPARRRPGRPARGERGVPAPRPLPDHRRRRRRRRPRAPPDRARGGDPDGPPPAAPHGPRPAPGRRAGGPTGRAGPLDGRGALDPAHHRAPHPGAASPPSAPPSCSWPTTSWPAAPSRCAPRPWSGPTPTRWSGPAWRCAGACATAGPRWAWRPSCTRPDGSGSTAPSPTAWSGASGSPASGTRCTPTATPGPRPCWPAWPTSTHRPRRSPWSRPWSTASSERTGQHPNVDAALGALAVTMRMVPGAGEAVFALARTAGWVAHALEQYDSATFMRTRVDYLGPRPEPAPPHPVVVRDLVARTTRTLTSSPLTP